MTGICVSLALLCLLRLGELEGNSEKEPSSQMKCESVESLMKLAKENCMYSFKKGLSLLPNLLVFTYPDQTSVCLSVEGFFPCQLQKKRKEQQTSPEVLESGFGL